MPERLQPPHALPPKRSRRLRNIVPVAAGIVAAFGFAGHELVFAGDTPGPHQICVRAVSADGLAGPETCIEWTREPAGNVGSSAPPSPDHFSISGDLPTLLSPGTGGPLPLTVSNPNDFGVLVSELVVSVQPGSSRPGCDGPANLLVTQSNAASGAVSILVPAHGSVTLPDQGATAPQVAMLNLPTNQDACKGAAFTLGFSGTARTTS